MNERDHNETTFEVAISSDENINVGETRRITLLNGIAALLLFVALSFTSGFIYTYFEPNISGNVRIFFRAFLGQFSIALVAILLMWRRGFGPRDLGFRNLQPLRAFAFAVSAYIMVLLFNIIFTAILVAFGLKAPAEDVYTQLFAHSDYYSVIMLVLLTVVLAPIIEETVFRGVLYSSLRSKLKPCLAILISAIIFSTVHMQIWGFVQRLALGIALAWIYERENSLYPSITLHAVNNAVAVAIALNFKI